MQIREITEDKTQYMSLLLLGDEQEDMVMKYLPQGRLFVLEDEGCKALCVVTDEGDGILELKNIAVEPASQGKGMGKALIEFLAREFSGRFHTLQAGTGESPLTLPFYEKCGFAVSHRVPDFFTTWYDHPIFEGGVQLKDMIYLRKKL